MFLSKLWFFSLNKPFASCINLFIYMIYWQEQVPTKPPNFGFFLIGVGVGVLVGVGGGLPPGDEVS